MIEETARHAGHLTSRGSCSTARPGSAVAEAFSLCDTDPALLGRQVQLRSFHAHGTTHSCPETMDGISIG